MTATWSNHTVYFMQIPSHDLSLFFCPSANLRLTCNNNSTFLHNSLLPLATNNTTSSSRFHEYHLKNTIECLFLLLVRYRQRLLTPLAGLANFAPAPSKYNFTNRLIENKLMYFYLAAHWKNHKSTLVSLHPLKSQRWTHINGYNK